ncbi:hypothetical protein MC885_020076 [Smutsia gigantea]|nr:hypothetical protein MC885_020076 [Smutsia gigantea]
MSRGLQLLLLSCACSLAPATREVQVACSADVELPCPASWDPQVSYTVSWAKGITGGCARGPWKSGHPATASHWSPAHVCSSNSQQPAEAGEERMNVRQQGGLRHPQKEHRRSVGAAGEMLYSLKIQNATSCSSGLYRCTLGGPGGQRNPSGMVTLKVTGCPKERREETFKKYRAEIALLLALVVFYSTLIIFTCKFARQQSIFPDFSKPAMEPAFLPVTSPHQHLEPVGLHKTEVVVSSKAEGSSVVPLDKERMSPTRKRTSCDVLHLMETSESESHPTLCEQDFENPYTTT